MRCLRVFGTASAVLGRYCCFDAANTSPTLRGDILGLHVPNDFCYMGVGTAYGFVSRYPLKAPLLA